MRPFQLNNACSSLWIKLNNYGYLHIDYINVEDIKSICCVANCFIPVHEIFLSSSPSPPPPKKKKKKKTSINRHIFIFDICYIQPVNLYTLLLIV